MTQWTQPARALARRILENHRRRFEAEGADAAEVVADLHAHLDREVERLALPVVTEEDVRRILAAVDPALLDRLSDEGTPISSGDAVDPLPEPTSVPPVGPATTPVPSAAPGVVATLFLALLGVLLPLVTVVFEWQQRLCASELFEPFPTGFHVAAVLWVPAAVAIALLRLHSGNPATSVWLRRSVGVAAGIAAFYAVLLLPFQPFAAIGVLYFGIGLLPMSPLISWIVLWRIGSRLAKAAKAGGAPVRRIWPYGLAAFLALWGAMVPETLTQIWARRVAAEAEPRPGAALKALRLFGSESALLRACYGSGAQVQNFLGLPTIGEEEARSVYFRVTGKAFNEVRPPLSPMKGAGRGLFREFEWDSDLGGETVGGLATGLSLQSSRIDAMVHAADGWGYTEWTFEFRNDHVGSPREARAVLQLPAGGVVSRVTLWVQGEEREAAFAGRAEVRKAYQEVAVVKRRDPILVTTAGPDRVLMQCFPVPEGGGIMRVRIGVTAPLQPLSGSQVAFLWPRIADRNFAIRDSLRHHAWLEVPDGTLDPVAGWDRDAERPQALHASASQTEFERRLSPIRLGRVAANGGGWLKEDRGTAPAWLRRTLEEVPGRAFGRVAVVVDGGLRGAPLAEVVRQAFEKAGSPTAPGRFSLWFARDGARRWPKDGTLSDAPSVAAAIAAWKEPFDGGHDPFPALEAAWDWAAGSTNGLVLWIHATQPLSFTGSVGLVQRLERAGHRGPRILDVTDLAVPDRVLESLPASPLLGRLPRIDSLAEDLRGVLRDLDGGAARWTWKIERRVEDPGNPTGPQASRHVARLWAAGEVDRLLALRRKPDAVALASQWQLVTPVTGAVVLETKEQFDQHGLAAIDPATAPGVVPEPETWALLLVGATVVLLQAGRSRRKG